MKRRGQVQFESTSTRTVRETCVDIWDTNKLVLFIAFVIPGFVSLKTYELLFPGTSKDSDKQLIDAVAYSSANYALLLWPIYAIETHGVRDSYPTAYILFYVFVLLIAPISWACAIKALRTTELFQQAMPHPTAKPWDYVFGRRKPYWIVVTLKDGKQIAGRFDSSSFASSAPAPEQLYLEETWVLNSDGGFERPRSETAGILILSSEIMTVEFFNLTTGENHVGQEAVTGRLPATSGAEGVSAPIKPSTAGEGSGGLSAADR